MGVSKEIETGPPPEIIYKLNPLILSGSGDSCPSVCDFSLTGFGSAVQIGFSGIPYVGIGINFNNTTFTEDPIVLVFPEYSITCFQRTFIPSSGMPGLYLSACGTSSCVVNAPVFDVSMLDPPIDCLTAGIVHFRIIGCVSEEISNGG